MNIAYWSAQPYSSVKLLIRASAIPQGKMSMSSSSEWLHWRLRPTFSLSWRKAERGKSETSSVSIWTSPRSRKPPHAALFTPSCSVSGINSNSNNLPTMPKKKQPNCCQWGRKQQFRSGSYRLKVKIVLCSCSPAHGRDAAVVKGGGGMLETSWHVSVQFFLAYRQFSSLACGFLWCCSV